MPPNLKTKNKNLSGLEVKRIGAELIIFIILAAVGFCMLYPFLWMLFTSFKPLTEVFTTGFFKHTWIFKNYVEVWDKVNIIDGLKASAIFSLGLTFSQTLTSAMAGYAFEKISFPFKNTFFFIILASMTIPYVTIMLPQFMALERFGLVSNGPWGYIIPRVSGGAATIFFVRQYCRNIPDAFIESAKMDGAGQGKIFFSIILPMIIPAIATQALFIFIFIWNDYLGPSIFLIDKNWWTIQLYVARFSSGQIGSAGAANIPMQMTVAMIITIPLFVLFLHAQKYIINSLISGGIKE